MKALKDHEIVDIDGNSSFLNNRGFRYGDGLFETIAVINGKPRLLNDHLQRLKNGATILALDVDNKLDFDRVSNDMRILQKENEIAGNAIVRFYLWRNSEGRYTPIGRTASTLLTIEQTSFKKINSIHKAGFSEKTINFPSTTASLKTISALKYVIAGLEMREKNLDEIIILDYKGIVSEALSSNIFWKKGDTYYTPPLSAGCIDGIMRKWLISELKRGGYPFEEKLVDPSELIRAQHIFTTNATGVGHIEVIGDATFEIEPIVQKLIERIS